MAQRVFAAFFLLVPALGACNDDATVVPSAALREDIEQDGEVCLHALQVKRQNVQQNTEEDLHAQSSLDSVAEVSDHSGFPLRNRGRPSGMSPVWAQPTGQSLCIDGRLVPSTFLIGVQKGATSTLALQIAQSPNVLFGTGGKELHFFDSESGFRAHGGKRGYLHQFPLCPSNANLVALDGTPNTFQGARPWKKIFAPRAIREVYGDAAGNLTFILTIREPMLRMHSAFYHAKSLCEDATKPQPPWNITPSVCKTTFNDYVKETLDSREGALWQYSQYTPPLRQWFDAFDPSQFIIVPFLYVVDANSQKSMRNPSELVQYIWRTLDVPSAKYYVPDYLNKGSHPQLEDDIAPDVLEKFNETFQMNSSSRGIARLLHRSGATLWGCSACDEGAIVDWIETGWR